MSEWLQIIKKRNELGRKDAQLGFRYQTDRLNI